MSAEAPRYIDKKSGSSTDQAKEIAERFDFKNETKDKYSKLRVGLKDIVSSHLPKREAITWKSAADTYIVDQKSDIRGLLDVLKRNLPKANLNDGKYAGLAYSNIFKTVNLTTSSTDKKNDVNWLEAGDKIYVENGTIHVIRKENSHYNDFTVDLYPWSDDNTAEPKPRPAPKAEMEKAKESKLKTPPSNEVSTLPTVKDSGPSGIEIGGKLFFGTYEDGPIKTPKDGYYEWQENGENIRAIIKNAQIIYSIENGKFDAKTGNLTEGKVRFANGQITEGEWSKETGKFEKGKITFPSGTIEEGEWYDSGFMSGRRTHPNGVIEEGYWWGDNSSTILKTTGDKVELYEKEQEYRGSDGMHIVVPESTTEASIIINGRPFFGTLDSNGKPFEGLYEWWDQDSLELRSIPITTGSSGFETLPKELDTINQVLEKAGTQYTVEQGEHLGEVLLKHAKGKTIKITFYDDGWNSPDVGSSWGRDYLLDQIKGEIDQTTREDLLQHVRNKYKDIPKGDGPAFYREGLSIHFNDPNLFSRDEKVWEDKLNDYDEEERSWLVVELNDIYGELNESNYAQKDKVTDSKLFITNEMLKSKNEDFSAEKGPGKDEIILKYKKDGKSYSIKYDDDKKNWSSQEFPNAPYLARPTAPLTDTVKRIAGGIRAKESITYVEDNYKGKGDGTNDPFYDKEGSVYFKDPSTKEVTKIWTNEFEAYNASYWTQFFNNIYNGRDPKSGLSSPSF
jgi:hypothetical protein